MSKLINFLNRNPNFYFPLSTFITSGGNFLLIVMLWNKLNVYDFAIISILEIIPLFGLSIMTFSFDQYLMRHYYEWDENHKTPNIFYLWIISLILGLFFFIFFSILAFVFATNFFNNDYAIHYSLMSLFNIYIISIYNIPFSVIRITNRPKIFFWVKVLTFLVYSFMIYFLLFQLNFGVIGYFISLVASNIFHLFLTLLVQKGIIIDFFLLRNKRSNLSLSNIFKYLLPLVPSNILGSAVGVLERFFLQSYVTPVIIGHYGIANKFAELINQLHGIMKLSYGPSLYKTISSKKIEDIVKFSHDVKRYIFPLLLMFTFMIAFSNLILEIIGFKGASLIVELMNLLLVSITLYSLQIYVSPGLIVTKKTSYKLFLDFMLFATLGFSAYYFLKNYNLFLMLKIKILVNIIFILISYFITIRVIDWKLDMIFLFKNVLIMSLFILFILLNPNIIYFYILFILFVTLNGNLILTFYENHK